MTVQANRPKPAVNTATGGKPKVLVIDDEAPIREMFVDLLGSRFDIMPAQDGEDGLLKFGMGKFDVVVCDRDMPGMKGDEVIKAIKRQNPGQKVIMAASGAADLPETVKKSIGADVYVNKPYSIIALADKIGELAVKTGFNLYLPMQTFVKPQVVKPVVTGGKSAILVIDDDKAVRFLLGRALTNDGYNVALAFDGDDGLLKFQPGAFSVVICDRNVPRDKQGDEVVKAIKRMDPQQKVILYTIDAPKITDTEKASIGADRYIAKDEEDLVFRGAAEIVGAVRELDKNKN